MSIELLPPGLNLHLKVRAGFIKQGTSLKHWCDEQSIGASNARDALIGRSNGPKARALRQRLIEASGAQLGPDEFNATLRRLKVAVGLDHDQDVAALLGMNKGAFHARKKRGAFPVDKLKALALDRPDLELDATYILTGVRS